MTFPRMAPVIVMAVGLSGTVHAQAPVLEPIAPPAVPGSLPPIAPPIAPPVSPGAGNAPAPTLPAPGLPPPAPLPQGRPPQAPHGFTVRDDGPRAVGAWIASEPAAPGSRPTSRYAALRAFDGTVMRPGSLPSRGTMTQLRFDCRGGALSITVTWPAQSVSASSFMVQTRLGSRAPVSSSGWQAAQGGTAIVLARADAATRLARTLRGERDITVIVDMEGGGRATARFTLAGFDAITTEMRQTCRF